MRGVDPPKVAKAVEAKGIDANKPTIIGARKRALIKKIAIATPIPMIDTSKLSVFPYSSANQISDKNTIIKIYNFNSDLQSQRNYISFRIHLPGVECDLSLRLIL